MKISWLANKNINKNKVDGYLESSIKNNHFTNYGPNVKLLEMKIRELFKIDKKKSVIVVNNGSVAVQIMAMAIEYIEGNINWATQAFTFPPSIQANLMKTKIVDIDSEGGLDLEDLGDDINGIIVTNIFGNCVNINKYEKYCKKKKIFLIFDNAATSYTFYNGKNCCNYGIGSSISFHHTKPFGFGEGGAIIIDNKYSECVRKLINFGINLDGNYCVREGVNGKMSDINAVYILQYLDDNFDKIVKKHKQLYDYFSNQISILYPSFHDYIVPSCFCLLFDRDTEVIMNKLLDNGIYCRRYYHPLEDKPKTIEFYNSIVCIPCNIDMEFSDIDFIVSIIKDYI